MQAWARELQRTSEMIDPDRTGAADKSRALDVMKLALAERKDLVTRWAWDAVQDEARWLAAQLEREEGQPKPVPGGSSPDAGASSVLPLPLDGGAVPRAEARRTVVELHEEGAHFRQNEWTTVAIALTVDEVVEIETTHARQDESYY